MSARRAGPPEPVLSLLVIAAALVGGLAAAEIVHTRIVITLIVSLVAAGIAIFALFLWPGSPAPIEKGDADRSRFPLPPDPDRRKRPVPAPVPVPGTGGDEAEAKTAVQLLPANPQAPDASWWDLANQGPPPPSPGARRAPAPYLSATQIAQCPNCGSFGLEIGEIRGGWGFRCESCAHAWAWRPGTPWPLLRVAPRRRTQARPQSPPV